MTLSEILEAIIGVLTTLGVIGGGTAYQKSNKKHQESTKERVKLENRLTLLEAKENANTETLKDIKGDLKYIRERLDKGAK